MNTFFKTEMRQAVPQNTQRLSLTRAFVETGDERCPLKYCGIWSRLPELDAALDDDPGLTRPARGVFLFGALPWRAIHLRVTGFCYRTA